MAYAEELAKDSVNKKLEGVLIDGGAANVFVAKAGGTKITAHGEDSAPELVELSTTAGGGATIGATADAAVDSDAVGTLSGKLRGLVKLFAARIPILGQALMAASSPVTIASDQSAVPVTDGGGALTVDGTVTVQDGGGALTVDSAQLPAALGQTTMAIALPVVMASDQDFIKAEDAAHSSGDKGIMALGVRQDTPAALAGTTGDYLPLTMTSMGFARVADHADYATDFFDAPIAGYTGDIRNGAGAALADSDLQIRDANEHQFQIPMYAGGWRDLTIFVYTAPADVHDQNLTFKVYGAYSMSAAAYQTELATWVLTANDDHQIAVSRNAGGLGYVTGVSPVPHAGGHYPIPALGDFPIIRLSVQAAGIPTKGEINLYIARRS